MKTIKRKRTEIVFETDRFKLVTVPGSLRAWCTGCDTEVEMISLDDAAVLKSVSTRVVFAWVNEGRAHFLETSNGLLRVCPHSLD